MTEEEEEKEKEIAEAIHKHMNEIVMLGTQSKDFVTLSIAGTNSLLMALIYDGDMDEIKSVMEYGRKILLKKRELITELKENSTDKKSPIIMHPGTDKLQ